MPLRSMTGFAQVKGQVSPELGFTLSLKSVNHRFLDVHFRLPADSDVLEMKLRRLLKEKLARGHLELSLNLERGGGESLSLNRQIVGGYIQAFRAAAAEFGLAAEPERILQEAALLVDRSDIQEELVRLETHVKHFLSQLDQKGEVGKKLDFLLQEMNREANTLLSKTSGLAGEALDITQMGLAIK